MVLCVVRAACKFDEVLLFPEGGWCRHGNMCILPDLARLQLVQQQIQFCQQDRPDIPHTFGVENWLHVAEKTFEREIFGVCVTLEKKNLEMSHIC